MAHAATNPLRTRRQDFFRRVIPSGMHWAAGLHSECCERSSVLTPLTSKLGREPTLRCPARSSVQLDCARFVLQAKIEKILLDELRRGCRFVRCVSSPAALPSLMSF